MSDVDALGGDELSSDYLAFAIGGQDFATDILRVQEIRGYEQPTALANAPEFLKGVINLRGTMVPIVDLRIWFKVAAVEYSATTVVMILNLGDRVIGAVVDEVSDVLSINPRVIQPPPKFSANVNTAHIIGMAEHAEKIITLVDVRKLLASDELGIF